MEDGRDHRVGRDIRSALLSKTTMGARSYTIRLVRSADNLPLPSNLHSDDSFVPCRHHHSTGESCENSLPNTNTKRERNTNFITILGDRLACVENPSLVMDMNNVTYPIK